MSKMMICPECKSTATKRLIVEWTVKEFVAVLIIVPILALRLIRGPILTADETDIWLYKFGIIIGFVALLVFPVLLNLRFPRYKCKSCGKKFKPNGEDAEDVFDEYQQLML